MRKYTSKELETYWMARCPDCGWKGLTCDCNGFDAIADSGDYDDGNCPKCDGNITEDEDYDLLDRLMWAWRFVSFWVYRENKRRAKELEIWCNEIADMQSVECANCGHYDVEDISTNELADDWKCNTCGNIFGY